MSSGPADKTKLLKRSKKDLIEDLVATQERLRKYEQISDDTKEADRLLVMALDVFPDVVLCYDKNEQIVFTNNAYHAVYPHSPPQNKIIGCSQEQLLRCSLDAGLIAHPLAKTDPERWLQMRLDERRSYKRSYVGETTHSTGRTYLYRHIKTPNGDTIIIQSDITERKEAEQKVIRANEKLEQRVEERTQKLQESEAKFKEYSLISSDWFWEMDEHLRFTYFSARNREITGFDPSIYIGKTRREIAAERTVDEKWHKHLDDLDNHRPFRNFHYDLSRADGSRLTISISGKPILDRAGKFRGYLGTGTDITDRRRAEEARDEAWREAEQANLAKSEFLATMSHEFRTPLNAILGFSELLRAQYFGPLGSDNYKEYARDIHQSGKHMLALVNDVLDIASIEAGQRSLTKELISIKDVLEGCVRKVIPATNKSGIDLSCVVHEGLAPLYADKRSVIQIILNLLSNAIKFTEKNGTISVSAKGVGQKLTIKVSDSGIGISPDRLSNITEPFSQSHVDPHKTQDGTGLGLSIVESLVNAHDGELNIESEIGKGTTVTVTFPFQEVEIIE